jgi:hypothetical protein
MDLIFMKKTDIKTHKHTYLFWLIIPIIVVWLTIGYVIGFLREKPIWYKSDQQLQDAPPHLQQYKKIPGGLDQPFVTFWFDDAWLSQYMKAYPELRTNDFPGTIAVPTDLIEKPGYMNWAQLRIMRDNGWEITNHSKSHNCKMNTWDENKIKQEYKASRLTLWKNQLTSDIFVTPCGVDSPIMRAEAEKLFVAYRTVDPGFNNTTDFDIYNLKVKNIDSDVKLNEILGWIDTARKNKSWLIIVFHKIDEVGATRADDQFNTSLQDFKKIVDHVKSQNIRVVTPSQIIQSR